MSVLIALIFLTAPLLSSPLVLTGYLYDQKRRTLYSIFAGVLMGIVAYFLNPPVSYDLYRHHESIDEYSTYSWSYFSSILPETSEPLQALANYVVSLTNNGDLLQFSIVAIGYSILFYIIGDFARRYKIERHVLLIILVFTLASFTCTNFFSGLWNYIAMILFALAFYWDILCRKSHWLTYPLYIITPLVHSSMFFPLILIVLFKLFKEKAGLRSAIVTALLFVTPAILLPVINSLSGVPIFAQLAPMYNAYFLNGERFLRLYGGNVMVLEILKIVPYAIAALFMKYSTRDNRELEGLRNFIPLLIIATIALVINGVVFLRFVLLIQFIGALLLMVALNKKQNTLSAILIIFITVLTVVALYQQYITLNSLDFEPLGIQKLLTPLWQIFQK